MQSSTSPPPYYWTKNRVLAGVRLLHEAKVPLTLGETIRDPSHRLSRILIASIGKPVSGEALYKAACRQFGSWDRAVKEAGADLAPPSFLVDFWNKKMVAQAIGVLYDAGCPVSYSLFYLDQSPRVDRVLEKVFGRRTSRKLLFQAAIQHYGSWERAVEVALMPPEERWYIHFWTKPRIRYAIRSLHQAGVDLSVGKIWRDRSPRLVRVLKASVGRATTGAALYQAGRTYFPSWSAALRSAGVDPAKVRRHHFWNRENLILAIQVLEKKHISLASSRISQDRTLRTQRVIHRAVGQVRTGRNLMISARGVFGSWSAALHAAGIDPQSVRLSSFRWDKRIIARLIRALHGANIALEEKRFSKDKSVRTEAIIFAFTGRTTRARWIHQLARWKFGSWDHAVQYALHQSDKKSALSEKAQEEARDNLSLYIRRLHDQGFRVNYRAMATHSDQILAFNQGAFGENVSGFTLIGAATKYLGSWDAALEAAQLDPLEIRKRARPRTSSLSVTPHQVERVSIGAGEVRKVAFLGAPPKNPEELLEDDELAESLKAAMDELDDDELEVAEEIFDIVLQMRRFQDQNELVKLVVQYSNGTLSEHRVRTILKKLAQSAALSVR